MDGVGGVGRTIEGGHGWTIRIALSAWSNFRRKIENFGVSACVCSFVQLEEKVGTSCAVDHKET